MAKAIIWCRVSTDKQEWETQKKDLLREARKEGFLEEENNVILIGEAGASARKMNDLYLKEVNELLETIHSTPDVSTIFVWEVSRLARNEVAFYKMKDEIINNHIQFICNVPQLRLLDDDGEVNRGSEITLNLLVTLAKQEMEISRKRFARGKKRLADSGKYNGGAIPYGYKVDADKNIIPDEGGEADIVREIFNMYEHGYSQPSIAKELFERGVKGRASRATRKFTISLVHQILTNTLLTGEPHLSKGASYVRTYPMIITPEQFKRCRKIASDNNTVAPKSKRVYYAHRLIKCVGCGRWFVSTGGKGYYHCWDATYPTRDINGYYDTPRCTNRICISTNIMDSLLWELAQQYETTFILNSAKQKIAECESAKALIEQKIQALPLHRKELDDRMDLLLDARAEGMKKEKFLARKRELLREQKEIESTEAEYREQIKHYDVLIEEVKHSLETHGNLERDEAINAFIDNLDSVKDEVSSITDDEERSRIIHKHIEKVTVEATTVNYKFGIHPDGKDASAKKITVYSFIERPREFCFIPNNGKGGVMLEKVSDGGDIEVMGKSFSQPMYIVFPLKYLPRIIDKGKYKRREEERARRANIKSLGTDELRNQGYISMNEMREISNLSYSTLYKAIKEGKMKGKNMFKTWYVLKEDFEEYIRRYNPQPRPFRQTTKVAYLEKSGLDKLYEEIMNVPDVND